jgi:uncharacterized repeat protein (TIGR01451 family)/CSLREA domain-containing protein
MKANLTSSQRIPDTLQIRTAGEPILFLNHSSLDNKRAKLFAFSRQIGESESNSKILIWAFALFSILLLPAIGLGQPVKTFTVNMTGDQSDPNAGTLEDDGHCDVDPNTPGDQCTLRAAIENHNGNRNLGQNEIKFNIPNAPGTGSILINVGETGLGALPNVLGSVIINAKNGPDGRHIELNGSMAGANAAGLKLLGGQCQISSFIINSFSSYGIFISGTPPPGEGAHVIKGNYIGTDATGKISKGNGGDGIFIDNTGNDTIGGTTFDDMNIISGNKGYGIVIHGADPQIDFQTNGAKNNMVKGNFIGLDVDGNLVLPNEKGGILDENAPNNRFGDSTDKKAANTLAGVKNGITVMGSLSEGVGIEGNFFKNGAGAKFSTGIFGRGGKGLYITGNLLDDIDSTAIDLFLDANGTYNIRKNRFEGSIKTGTKLRFGPGRTAEIDYVNNFHVGTGLAVDAEESLNSNINWLFLGDTMRAGQAGANIIFKASGKKNFTDNRWEGMSAFGLNYVSDLAPGVQATLTETNEVYANNGTEGVHGRIQGGGELALNIFDTRSSGNGTDGSRLDVFASASARIDITARGNEYTFSGRAGLRITSDGQALPLATFIFEKNILDHNNFVGLELFNSAAIFKKSITNNTITNNTGPGIQMDGSNDAHIDSNTISGNATGILINDASIASINNNTITDNGKGIALAGTGTGILMTGNSIFNNTELGIDLGNDGVTPNHPGGPITGPNNFQNHPELTNASGSGSNTIIQGTLNSAANATYKLEFFSNIACNPSGFGDGQTFLGFDSVTTDASGNANFSITLTGVTVPVGSSITSTATDPNNNTSEFSKCLLLGGASQLADLEVTKTAESSSFLVGDTVTFTITLSNKGPDQGTGIAVRDTLPAGITLNQATASAGTYNNNTGIWSLNSLNKDSIATLVIAGTFTQPGTITNTTAIISSDQPDPNGGNNKSSVTLTVQQRLISADLQLTKTADKTSLTVGQMVTYTLTLTNKGPDKATGISVSDVAPAGLSLGQVIASVGSYNATTGIWTVSSLNSGNQAVLTIVATSSQPGTIINKAAITASGQADPDTINNQSSITVTVQQVIGIEKQIQNLISKVDILVSSKELTRPEGNLLTIFLKIALVQYREDDTRDVINTLRGFELVVNLFTRFGLFSDKSRQELINAAQQIIDELRRPGATEGKQQDDTRGENARTLMKYITLSNYPNPFSRSTVISFDLIKEGRVQLSIYDESGRMIKSLLDQVIPAGTHNITWETGNLAAGFYTVQLRTEGIVKAHRMVHVK